MASRGWKFFYRAYIAGRFTVVCIECERELGMRELAAKVFLVWEDDIQHVVCANCGAKERNHP